MNDLTDKKFGKLLVLNPHGRNEYRQMLWACQCECGRLVEVLSHHLTSGNTRSCGKCPRTRTTHRKKILRAGQIFGRLAIVYEYDGSKDAGGNRLYQCACRCGNPDIIWVRATDLITRHKVSCGACAGRGMVRVSVAVLNTFDSVDDMTAVILKARPGCKAIYAEETGEVLWVKDKDISDWGVFTLPHLEE